MTTVTHSLSVEIPAGVSPEALVRFAVDQAEAALDATAELAALAGSMRGPGGPGHERAVAVARFADDALDAVLSARAAVMQAVVDGCELDDRQRLRLVRAIEDAAPTADVVPLRPDMEGAVT